jgi:hypothetical protein
MDQHQQPSNRLCLRNVPIELTRIQLKEKFFKELVMDIKKDFHFPKNLYKREENLKIVFIQFATVNGR